MPNNKLKYPLEDTDYKARVVFSVIKEVSTGLSATFEHYASVVDNNAKSITQSAVDKVSDLVGVGTITESVKKKATNEIKSQAKTLKDNVSSFNGEQKRHQSASKSSTVETTHQISLYLPQGLAFRDNVTYENFDLGAIGASMEAGTGFAMSMIEGLGSFIDGFRTSGTSDLARLAGVRGATKFGTFGAELAAVQKLAGGVTLNPNSRVLFKQPNIREFAFAFKMIAKSEREADEINQIIKLLRTELYPDEIEATVSDVKISLGYKFPNKFQIEFEYDDKEIPGLAKIQPCYLRDVATTFNASQMAMHKDGNFMEVDMTLSFQETRALARKDIEAGY